jgi:hypothetical protein
MRYPLLLGTWLALAELAVPGRAVADAPPMPPCPPGWEQVDAFSCREPIRCPAGWKLDAGPVCVPFECQKDRDCNWKGIVPCKEAGVCAAGSGRAVRVCDTEPGGRGCPSGLTCQKRKLCGRFAGGASGAAARFENWEPGQSQPTPAVTPSAEPVAGPVGGQAAAATPARESPTPPSQGPTRRTGCQLGAGSAPTTGGSPLALLAATALWGLSRRGRRRPEPTSAPQRGPLPRSPQRA